MNRRDFIHRASLGGIALSFPTPAALAGCDANDTEQAVSSEFLAMIEALLQDWCDGMIEVQIDAPDSPEIHGALDCPACNKIHGRCMDAVYPFMYMADATGDNKYLEAAIRVLEWADNVSTDDGAWTVIPNPKSWKGITVFGAIALGEALYYHGHLLDLERKARWMDRLARAANYVYKEFDLTFTNINYGFTAIYALNLLGRVLDNTIYTERSHELARGARDFFTAPNKLLFGEAKPSTRLSDKGLYGVDLGYNVEESLNGVALYALHENDQELLQLLTESMLAHTEFMLPDGAWDNSWGTRQFKWSYWGSRTTDGCQAGFGMMAGHSPVLGTAAIRNTELLKRCTADGLLHGGPHFVSHGIKPCVHHTFAHAKPLAALLDAREHLPDINTNTPLPRATADGIRTFPEIDTSLLARGPWRGTVTSYDAIYYTGLCRQATGGALAVLHHSKAGLLLAASMAKYELMEKNNQQPQPNEDFAFTPRLETFVNGEWYTNLYDLAAEVDIRDKQGVIQVDADIQLKNRTFALPEGTAADFHVQYIIDNAQVVITAQRSGNVAMTAPTTLVLPVISPTGEKVTQVSDTRITIEKPEGVVRIASNFPIKIKASAKGRLFNQVPGAEAIPLLIDLPRNKGARLECTISVA